jgi:hypothetical protein
VTGNEILTFNGEPAQAHGVTDSERFLKRLCDRTFLSLWSHAGVFHDKALGQEVCDLLVIFENHILIFSDKACEFPDTGNAEVDWKRWFRRAITRSTKQVRGAERWIRKFPDRLFLDTLCTVPFPLEVPDLASANFHRVIVAHGATNRCRDELGGRGSLIIAPDVIGDERPFHTGNIDSGQGYIHVLDDVSLEIVMGELDTITDFVDYLSSKEQLILGGNLQLAAGEENLLAHFLFPIEGKDKNQFVLPADGSRLAIADGLWNEFDVDPYRIQRRQDNEVSYFWDHIIETFSKQSAENRLYYSTHPGIYGVAATFRIPARETRTRRRMLSIALSELVADNPPPGFAQRRIVQSEERPGICYAFLLVSRNSTEQTPNEYRHARQVFLNMFCEAVKIQFPDTEDIIGIATELERYGPRSFDVVYRDARIFTEEERERAEAFIADMKLFTNLVPTSGVEYDYPIPAED